MANTATSLTVPQAALRTSGNGSVSTPAHGRDPHMFALCKTSTKKNCNPRLKQLLQSPAQTQLHQMTRKRAGCRECWERCPLFSLEALQERPELLIATVGEK